MVKLTRQMTADGLVWVPNPLPYGIVTIESAGSRSKYKGIKKYEGLTIIGAVRVIVDFIRHTRAHITLRQHNINASIYSPQTAGSVERRGKHFEWLHARLQEKYPALCVPPLPDKQYFSQYGETFQAKRIAKLQAWINRCNFYFVCCCLFMKGTLSSFYE